MIREATDIKLHPNYVNTEDFLCLSWSLKPFIHYLKEHKSLSHRSSTCLSLAANLAHPFRDIDPAPASSFFPISHPLPTL